MKSRFIHFKKRFIPALSGALMGVMFMSTTCFAAGDTSAVTQPLENLKTLIIVVIGAVSVIILAKECHGVCTSLQTFTDCITPISMRK